MALLTTPIVFRVMRSQSCTWRQTQNTHTHTHTPNEWYEWLQVWM